MCKDKWNSFNFDYKKIYDYHKGTGNHTCFWDLVFEEKERYHLPHPFYQEFYDQIEVFQGERNVTTPLHSIDINVKGDKIHKLAHAQETQERMKILNRKECKRLSRSTNSKCSWGAKKSKCYGFVSRRHKVVDRQ
jgi:hypothetical protein